MPIACESSSPAGFDWADVDLYRFFAFALSSPSRDRFDALAQPALKNALLDLQKQWRCAEEPQDFAWFEDYGDYEAAYIALFDVGIPGPPVPLFESAHDKSKPAQEIALENTWFYDVLGLKWNSSSAVPDYLITQLEFLASVRYALDNAHDAATKPSLAQLETDFLNRHILNWLPKAAARLDAASPSTFAPVLNLLLAFLKSRREEGANCYGAVVAASCATQVGRSK